MDFTIWKGFGYPVVQNFLNWSDTATPFNRTGKKISSSIVDLIIFIILLFKYVQTQNIHLDIISRNRNIYLL